MPTLEVINQEKQKVGTIQLSDEVFGADVNIPLVHQVIKAQLAGRRQGTAKTKVKSEVRGAVRSRSARRAPATPARVRAVRRSSRAVARTSARSRALTSSRRRRK